MPAARAIFYLLTLAALGLTVRVIASEPVSGKVVAAFAVVYVTALLLGVLVLRLRVFVDAVVRGPRGAKGVVLTFDDGPDPVWTPRALDALDAAGAKATFFVIGKKAEAHPEVVRDMLARGHTVGLHSYAHDRLFAMRGPRTWRRDLKKGVRVLKEITGERVHLFRPPIGHTVPHTPRVLRELHLRVIGWDVGARDGVRAEPEAVAARVLAKARDGSIVLLHDAAERGDHDPAGVGALPSILEGLKKRGLAVVPLGEWIQST
ncbi:MAG TPA: polysaccharide deacetylase family protein [Polyangiaceae bacterium]|nr:polysaccharide deacetylase family protein [Polyangiaceae bacterium]